MKFALIDPKRKLIKTLDLPTADVAKQLAGLKLGETDDAAIKLANLTPGISIIVAEFGLYVPADQQSYFAIAGRLYAGSAVLYAFDRGGNTIDLLDTVTVQWLPTAEHVEAAIAADIIERPHLSFNGKTYWTWPDPRPDMRPVVEAMAGTDDIVIGGDTFLTVRK